MKLVEIKKYNPSSRCWKNLIRKNTYDCSVENLIHRYQGFEGEILSITENLTNYDFINIKNHTLCLVQDNENPSDLLLRFFVKLGYEFGICDESTVYSSIFNEIIFGNIQQLVKKSILNEALLFPTKSLAVEYSEIHHKLLLEGFDVEDDINMEVYGIWCPSGNKSISI